MSGVFDLDQKIRAVCPIDGVSADGEVFFHPSATPEQRQAAQEIMDSYDPSVSTQSEFSTEIQKHIDATARARGYQDGFAMAGYSSSTVQAWADEANTFIAWRDAVWVYAYAQLSAVENGQRSPPATVEEFISELPVIDWGA